MRNFFLITVLLVLVSCQKAKDKATESITNKVLEKTLEQVGVASENIERANKNNAEVSINYNSVELFGSAQPFATVLNVAGKQMMVFSINSENAKINLSFSGLKDMLEHKPITGFFEKGKEEPKTANGTVVSITMAKENAFTYMLMEGEATITKLNQDEVVVEFTGKAGTFLDANSPENWKPIQGKISSKYPVMNFIQVKKEELFY